MLPLLLRTETTQTHREYARAGEDQIDSSLKTWVPGSWNTGPQLPIQYSRTDNESTTIAFNPESTSSQFFILTPTSSPCTSCLPVFGDRASQRCTSDLSLSSLDNVRRNDPVLVRDSQANSNPGQQPERTDCSSHRASNRGQEADEQPCPHLSHPIRNVVSHILRIAQDFFGSSGQSMASDGSLRMTMTPNRGTSIQCRGLR